MALGADASGLPPPSRDYAEGLPEGLTEGYPVSPRGTAIRPPPISATVTSPGGEPTGRPAGVAAAVSGSERPEEPAIFIYIYIYIYIYISLSCPSWDPHYALVESGATSAFRPALEAELQEANVIKVDLASGVTELHIHRYGTLLSSGPCQVILPAGYLVQLGFSIGWKKKGCVIRVWGCPLIPRKKGLQLLYEYEGLMESGTLLALRSVVGPQSEVQASDAWLLNQARSTGLALGNVSRKPA